MQLSSVDHYIVGLDFNFRKLYIIWVSDEVDTVIVKGGQVLGFKTKDALLSYAKEQSLLLKDGITYYNVYKIQQWLLEPNNRFDCNEFLNFWNLCIDISASVNQPFSGDVKGEIRNTIYDKLFDGSGVFIADDPNPVFTDEEVIKLAEITGDGVQLLTSNLSVQE